MYDKALMENYTSLFTSTKVVSQGTSGLHSPALGFSAGHHYLADLKDDPAQQDTGEANWCGGLGPE